MDWHAVFKPFEVTQQVCTIHDAPVDSVAAETCAVTDDWSAGLEPMPRHNDLQPDSVAVAVMIALLAMVALGAQHLRRLFANADTDLLGVRRRANAFESHTASESRTLLTLLLLGCACQAVLLGVAVGGQSVVSNGKLLGSLCALTVGWYMFQYAAYSVVGYVFTDSINASQWLKGFNLSQGILGLALALPAVTILYYHEATAGLLIAAGILYLIARIVFICKGFRIFYNNLASIVYFILYLCALEFIPVILVVAIAKRLDHMM